MTRGPKPKKEILERDAHIVKLIKDGVDVEYITQQFGLSRQRVHQIFRRYEPNWELPKSKPSAKVARRNDNYKEEIRYLILDKNITKIDDIAKIIGISSYQATKIVNSLKATDDEVANKFSFVGKKFGEWEVLEDTHYYLKLDGAYTKNVQEATNSSIRLKCRCSCGFEPYTFVLKANVLNQSSTGCMHCAVERSPNHISHR